MANSSFSNSSFNNSNTTFEDEVDYYDLTTKIDNLQQQVSALNDSQNANDDRYNIVKKENLSLRSKIDMLEEQLRDIEIQSEESRKEERRQRENMNRTLREKTFETEQYVNRVYNLQQELLEAKDESRKLQILVDRIKSDRSELELIIQQQVEEIDRLKDENVRLKELVKRTKSEEVNQEKVIEVLNHEIEEIRRNNRHHNSSNHSHARSDSVISNSSNVSYNCNSSRNNSMSDDQNVKLFELENLVHTLREENKNLKESNEELQAMLLNTSLEEGRSLLKEGERTMTSLADELVMSEEQTKKVLKEQQEVNAKLRAYIDGILLNIVENHPQLLEVRPKA